MSRRRGREGREREGRGAAPRSPRQERAAPHGAPAARVLLRRATRALLRVSECSLVLASRELLCHPTTQTQPPNYFISAYLSPHQKKSEKGSSSCAASGAAPEMPRFFFLDFAFHFFVSLQRTFSRFWGGGGSRCFCWPLVVLRVAKSTTRIRAHKTQDNNNNPTRAIKVIRWESPHTHTHTHRALKTTHFMPANKLVQFGVVEHFPPYNWTYRG